MNIMKRITLTIFATMMLLAVGFSGAAKEKIQDPQVTIALSDSTVFNGYLRCNLHAVDKKLTVSETDGGKKISYKVKDIDSIKVVFANGDSVTYRPIYYWDGFRRKVAKTPILSTVCYSSDNITCYKVPGMYVQSSAPVPSNYFQSYSSGKSAWMYYKKIKSESDNIKLMYTYIPSKKMPKLKSILKNVKNNFKKEDFEYIKAEVESQGITAEQLVDKPWIMLEILDNRNKQVVEK